MSTSLRELYCASWSTFSLYSSIFLLAISASSSGREEDFTSEGEEDEERGGGLLEAGFCTLDLGVTVLVETTDSEILSPLCIK